MNRYLVVVLSLLMVAIKTVGAEPDNSLLSITLSSEKVNIDSCTPLKIVRDNHTKKVISNTVMFVFKYSEGVKLFSDKQCKNVKEGIGQLAKDSNLIYYFKINRSGKFYISLIGIGKEKWSYSKNFQSAELDKVQASVKDRQAESMETYQKEKKLSDEEVSDNEKIEGEIKDIAYNNLKLEVSYSPTYRTNQCVGPINLVVPNLDNIIRNKQFATYEVQGSKTTTYYLDDKCTQETRTIKFEVGKAVLSIYLKNNLAEKVKFSVLKSGKIKAKGEFVFENSPEEYDRELEVQKFKERLDRGYFYTSLLPKITDQTQKDFYKEVYNNYENAKINNQSYQKDILEVLFLIDSAKDE